MNNKILKINVGVDVKSTLTLAQQAMEQLTLGEEPAPHSQVHFHNKKNGMQFSNYSGCF